jgi:hypothetical protein
VRSAGCVPVASALATRFHCVTDQRRRDYRGRETTFANPTLSGLRNSVATRNRQTEPGIARFHVTEFLEGPPRSHSHVVVLTGDHADVQVSRCAQSHPGLDGAVPTLLRQSPLRVFTATRCGVVDIMPSVRNLGDVAYAWAFNIEHSSFIPEDCPDLLALEFSDLFVVGNDGENWNQRALA